eukprot:CAMPEP_0177724434 /NCGR_PEP_ID=MMETSP0484_2-20121128/18728_1 /TAXON_ID=354590 /ORGANISM="Rhodomonas lens, Strain RHODO" /LENGTH=217 /DNA_ID=CAMNT_0019236905 /DNA_START=50 /DNA_END=699 /DNA_ORIENTATION=-
MAEGEPQASVPEQAKEKSTPDEEGPTPNVEVNGGADGGGTRPAAEDDPNAPKYVMVTLPEGATPGQTLQATSPDGVSFAFMVPPGVEAGGLIQVEVPPDARKQSVIQVRVPDGVAAGQEITATAPNGTRFTCTVPPLLPASRLIFVAIPHDQPQRPPPQLSSGQVSVVLPANALPGQKLQAQAPDGCIFTFTVPEGVAAGSTVLVNLPPASTPAHPP